MLQAGHRLGNYEIVSALGAGGQGVVYLARHLMLDRLDAVKVLQPNLAGDPGAQQRFQREAASAARLHHPNIAAVHDAGRAPDGSFYVAMHFVDGPSLDRIIPAGGLGIDRTVRLVAGVADALDTAHAHGLLHRDVKPGNVMVAQAGSPGEHACLVDFGIAKLVGDGRDARTGSQVLGTAAYMAPERLDGHTGDGRSDQYSLACMAYHCLVGTVPFPGGNGPRPARPVPASSRRAGLPPAIDAVLARGLSRDPADRFPTCAAFASALSAAANGASGRTRTAPLSPPPRPPGRAVGRAASGGWPPVAGPRPWPAGRRPLTTVGIGLATVVALAASLPLRRLITGQTAVPLDLGVQFTALVLLTGVCGGFGVWLLARRNPGAWFMLLLSALAAPALRAALWIAEPTERANLDLALQWVAFQPLEAGYSAFTIHKGVVTLSAHGTVLTALSVVVAAICGYGWWRWSTSVTAVSRVPSVQWPWLGGAAGAIVVLVLAVGGLPGDIAVQVAFALALTVVSLYCLARTYVEGWLLFLAGQVAHLSYAVTVADTHPRPPTMRSLGLVGPATPIAPSLALYYVAALGLGVIGVLTWLVDLRRARAS